MAALLALLAVLALHYRWRPALALTWLANVVGTVDLLYAFYQGTSRGVGQHLGSASYIPTFPVPALYVAHFMIFARLLGRQDEQAAARSVRAQTV